MSDAIRKKVLEALAEVAPEADLGKIDPNRPLREQVEIDSYDFLQFLLGIEERVGIAVPEADYARVQTLQQLVEYLGRRAGTGTAG